MSQADVRATVPSVRAPLPSSPAGRPAHPLVAIAAALACGGAAAQVTSFDGASGIVTIPSVQVGPAVYTDVKLLHQGNYVFSLQSANAQTPPGKAATRYDIGTGVLTLPAVRVGADTFLDVTLLNVGNFTFTLQGATALPADWAAGVNTLLTQYAAMWATSPPATGAARVALNDACYRTDGRTKAYLASDLDSDPAAFRNQYAYRVGETYSNVQVVAQRRVAVPGGGTRQELDVQYDATYADGSVARTITATMVTGDTTGTPGCTSGQNSTAWRFFGNQQLLQTVVRARNIRDERYLMSNGNAAGTPLNYQRDVQFHITDPMGNATYVIVSGPGPSATVGGVATPFSLKMISPRLLRSAPELVGVNGNYLNWADDDGFRYCRIAGSGVPLAQVADCVGQGATGNAYGWTASTPNASADASFDNLGFVAGGLYTIAVYNDDGWKTVNGHAGRTPIATYTDVLEKLPYRFVDMAGSGPTADRFVRFTTGQSPALVRSNMLSATPAAMTVTLSDLPAAPDGNVFRLYQGWEQFQGPKTGNASGVAYPGYRLQPSVFPGSQAKTFSWPITATLPGMSTKTYGEFTLQYVDRNDQQILSKVSFN